MKTDTEFKGSNRFDVEQYENEPRLEGGLRNHVRGSLGLSLHNDHVGCVFLARTRSDSKASGSAKSGTTADIVP